MTIRTLFCSGLALACFGSVPLAAVESQAERSGEQAPQLSDERIAEISARLAERPQLFARLDQNGDGQLASKEALAEHRDRAPDGGLRERLKERADADGDGSLSAAERAAAKALIHDRIEERAAKMKAEHPELFARLDRDGDGSLSPSELRHARALHQRKHGNHGLRDHARGEGPALD